VTLPILILPLAVQWWATWYPGAEPGGGSYIAQRMLAAKSERDALAGTDLEKSGGTYVAPTVLDGVDNSARVAQEEATSATASVSPTRERVMAPPPPPAAAPG